MLRVAICAHGYALSDASSGQEGLREASVFHPDLVIPDLGLPDIDGPEVIRRLREWTEVPITVLPVRDREDDKIAALAAGADDYLTKPFSMGELLARIRVAVRRITGSLDEPVMVFADLSIDHTRRLVFVHRQETKLTPTEYETLKYLALHADRVVTHGQLLRAVWGPNFQGETH